MRNDAVLHYPRGVVDPHNNYNNNGFLPLTTAASMVAAAALDRSTSSKDDGSSFPVRLHYLLDVLQVDGLAHLASWQPHGRCFVVYNPDEFSAKVLPMWFRQSRFGSFQRQLNMYGFTRLKTGRDKGGYYHKSFVRGQPHLAHNIKRLKVKKKNKPGISDVEEGETEEPDFYSIPFVPMTYPVPAMMAAPHYQQAPATLYVPRTNTNHAPPETYENYFLANDVNNHDASPGGREGQTEVISISSPPYNRTFDQLAAVLLPTHFSGTSFSPQGQAASLHVQASNSRHEYIVHDGSHELTTRF